MSQEYNKVTLKEVEEEDSPFAIWFASTLIGRKGCQNKLNAFNHLMHSAKETYKQLENLYIDPADLYDMASKVVKCHRDSLLAALQQDSSNAEHVRALCDWITSMLGQ